MLEEIKIKNQIENLFSFLLTLCVCVCERERDRERDAICTAYTHTDISALVRVCVRVCEAYF